MHFHFIPCTNVGQKIKYVLNKGSLSITKEYNFLIYVKRDIEYELRLPVCALH